MPSDTDPGIGIGTPITGVTPVVTTQLIPELCITYARSLDILTIDNKEGAYGQRSPEQCDVIWAVYQREGWIDKLRIAAIEIMRELGAPLCPKEIYDEKHRLRSKINLRQSPVAYLGKRTFSDWTEEAVVIANNAGTFELCDSSLGTVSINDVQFSYPDSVITVYNGLQALQAPTITRITATCGAGEDGYQISWPDYQLVLPTVDSTLMSESSNYLDAVKWRTTTVDADEAFEIVGECTCDCCQSLGDNVTLTLEDATEGIVCVADCSTGICVCDNREIRINYATDFSYGAGIDPAIEEAVVLYALTKADKTASKPCGCDNTMIDRLLEIDPTARTDFARNLRFGPTNAGMAVLRTMDRYLIKPHFNENVTTGGLLTARKRGTKRRRSYLRGF